MVMTSRRPRQAVRSTSKVAAGGILKAPAAKRVRRGVKRPVIKLLDKFKSGLERRISTQIESAGLADGYEKLVIKYERPSRVSKYTPDFQIGHKPIFIEAKGWFRKPADRQKMIYARDQNPALDIRIVFQKASLPIYKGSPTSHGKWATDNGFMWADNGVIPDVWLKEAKHAV